MAFLRNILLICILVLSILLGFFLFTQQLTVSTINPDIVTMNTMHNAISLTYLPYSKLTVSFGVIGLIYLKIIWKMVTSPNKQ